MACSYQCGERERLKHNTKIPKWRITTLCHSVFRSRPEGLKRQWLWHRDVVNQVNTAILQCGAAVSLWGNECKTVHSYQCLTRKRLQVWMGIDTWILTRADVQISPYNNDNVEYKRMNATVTYNALSSCSITALRDREKTSGMVFPSAALMVSVRPTISS